jgi:hypothetical protein
MYWPIGLATSLSSLVAHLVADHGDGGRVLFVGLGEVTALNHRPVEDCREVGVVAADVTEVVGIAEPHAGLGAVDRHDPLHLWQARQGMRTSSRVMMPGGVRGLGAEPLR